MAMNESAATPAAPLEYVEHLYAAAKTGMWADVWRARVGERELAAACSRYVKSTSGWTFLHQVAYAGDEAAVRVLLRLGASLSAQSKDGETVRAVATMLQPTRQRGFSAGGARTSAMVLGWASA